MDELFTQLGIGGLLLAFTLKEVIPILLKRKSSDTSSDKKITIHEINHSVDELEKTLQEVKSDVSEIKQQVHSLYEWHNIDFPDQPGVKVWYGTSLQVSIKDLSVKVESLSERLDKLDENQS